MSIRKRVRNAMFIVSVASIGVLLIISLLGLFNMRTNLTGQMQVTSETITTNNAHDMLDMSTKLAESVSKENARKINGDFARVKGELLTIKGDIEGLYRGNGLQITPDNIKRYDEYIVSKAVGLTQNEIDETVRVMAGTSAMFDNVLANEKNISLAYIVLENGMTFSSNDTFYPDVENADMRTRDWYKKAKASDTTQWSELYSGTDGRNYLTISVAARDAAGQVFGVVALDLRVNEISDIVLTDTNHSFVDAFIMNKNGEEMLSANNFSNTDKLKHYSNIKDFIKASENETGCYQDSIIIAGYADIEETGWILVNILDYEKALEPVQKIEKTVATATGEMNTSITKQIHTLLYIFAILFAILTAATVAVSAKQASMITKPLMELNKGVKIVADGKLDYFLEMHTGDEIETLAKSFNKMTGDLLKQMLDIKRITAEKERIGAELEVAKNIQASMLPSIFPPFPDITKVDIYASMLPAKEVGGDFYDFFLADSNHLVLVMADVSGKGVPAALFMVIAKTLIKNMAQVELSPKIILETVNKQLSANNDADMFVTVWLGVLDVTTGKMLCSNAGHEYPVIKHAQGDFELIKDKHGFVLAGYESSKYTEYELMLQEGDKIYLYTDGVAEATNADSELYGCERMLKTLNENKTASCRGLLKKVKEDVDIFVGNAPQFDDITMLCLEYKAESNEDFTWTGTPASESISDICNLAESKLENADATIKAITQINIAIDEIVSNVINHSGASELSFKISIENNTASLLFVDNGIMYDSTLTPEPDITLSSQERKSGGLGIFIVKKTMDSIEYEYKDNKNHLKITKSF